MKLGLVLYAQEDEFIEERDNFDQPGDTVESEMYAQINDAQDVIQAVNEFIELNDIEMPKGYVIGLVRI